MQPTTKESTMIRCEFCDDECHCSPGDPADDGPFADLACEIARDGGGFQ